MQDNHCHYNILYSKIENISDLVLGQLGLEKHQLSVSFVDEKEMTSLNQSYRNKDRSTDVLSFPQIEFQDPVTVENRYQASQSEELPPSILGDIVISLEDAHKNADKIGQDLDREVCFLIIHGCLHLCGHDHMNPKEEELMLNQQRKIMAVLEEDNSPPPWQDCVRVEA